MDEGGTEINARVITDRLEYTEASRLPLEEIRNAPLLSKHWNLPLRFWRTRLRERVYERSPMITAIQKRTGKTRTSPGRTSMLVPAQQCEPPRLLKNTEKWPRTSGSRSKTRAALSPDTLRKADVRKVIFSTAPWWLLIWTLALRMSGIQAWWSNLMFLCLYVI